jgi:hypothetical protein
MPDFDEEILKHLQWRSMVVALFEHRQDTAVPPQIIISDDKCQLGKWIYSSESDYLSGNEIFQSLKAVHKEFHMSAGTILTLVQQGKPEEAKNFEIDFYKQSDEVINCLKELKNL